MYASSHWHSHHLPWTDVVRWGARASALVLIVAWAIVAAVELFHPEFYVPPPLAYQGVALAVVFLGYALGWRHELAGGLLVLAGTATFFVINVLAIGTWPQPAAAWFAAPGALYLEAWRRSRRKAVQTASERARAVPADGQESLAPPMGDRLTPAER